MNYRLSAMMGGKLPDNNPAITDLNDPNRPMEIGEQFSGVYENDWTTFFYYRLWYNFLGLICRSYILQMAYSLNIGTLYIHSVTDIVRLLTFYYKS
jgi:hypothetical protein